MTYHVSTEDSDETMTRHPKVPECNETAHDWALENPAAGKLIVKSVNRNTIAKASHSEALHKALSALADDWTDTNDGFDYWGTDNEGEKWRVILKRRQNPLAPGPGRENVVMAASGVSA